MDQRRTRSMTSVTDFEFILTTIFAQKDDSPLHKALERDGVIDVEGITALMDRDIDRLKYQDTDSSGATTIVELGKGYQSLIRCFNAFVVTKYDEGTPVHGDWQNLVIKADFQDFRVIGMAKYVAQAATASTTTTAGGLSGSSSQFAPKAHDLVFEFKKGIKRDPASFTVMKDNKQWDSVHRTLIAQTNYQDVADVLDPAYVPKTVEEISLFEEKQKYMYSVLEKILQTDEGKVIVRSHDIDRDAQKIYAEYLNTMTLSTEAIMSSGEFLSYLTTAKISDGSWRGTSKGFVLHWIEQLRLYHDTVPLSDRLSDSVQRTMLQNAVHGLDTLQQVQISSDLQQTTHGTTLTFAQYRTLLLNAATGYDKRSNKPHSGGKPRRAAFSSETNFGDPYDLIDERLSYDDADTYDVDTTPVELLAYAMNRRERPQFKPGSRMPIARWKALSEQAQAIWDTMEDGDKAVILALNEDRKKSTASHHPKPDQSKYSINAHLTQDTPVDNVDDVLLSMVTKHTNRTLPDSHPADVRSVLSQPVKVPKVQIKEEVVVNGHKYVRQVQVHDIQYRVSQASRRKKGSLIDRGANGGIAGSDTRIIERHPHRTVDIRGIDNHEICSIPIVNAGAIVRSQRGEVIAIFNQYAYHPAQGRSIHSSCQLEFFANDVNDRSIHTPGGLQRIKTVDGYVFPLSVRDGLPYLDMRPYTDDEWKTLPHVIFTSDVDWDPRILDFDVEGNDEWYDAISDNVDHTDLFDVFGDYKGRSPDLEVSSADTWFETVAPDQYLRTQIEEATFTCSEHAQRARNLDHDNFADVLFVNDAQDVDGNVNTTKTGKPIDDMPPDQTTYDEWYEEISEDVDTDADDDIQARTFRVKDPDYEKLRPLFGWMNTKTIKKTFENTTQYARIPHGTTILKKHYQSPCPALNVKRRDEGVATDCVFSDTPAIDGGETCAQMFVGVDSLVTDIYGMKTEKQFVNTLEDNIRERGAMVRLLSDRAQVEISSRVVSILRALSIGQWQSEPHQQHQNPCERRYQTVKTTTNTLLDRSGSPAYTWLLCLMYVTILLNLTYNWTIGGIPLQIAEGTTQDISPLLRFYWWEPVYYKVDDASFPSDSREERGHFVGISRNVGNAMTYKILCDKSLKVLHRSNLRSAANPSDPNLRLDPLDGEKLPKSPRIVKSAQDEAEDSGDQVKPMVYFETGDLVGRTFLMKEDDEGLRERARIIEVIDDHERNVADNPFLIKFKCLVGEEEFEEILSYNEVMEHIEKDDTDGETFWKYKRISGHEGPLNKNHSSWKGDMWNVKVEWENGEISYEPLHIIAADDPVTCAVYAKDHGLLDTDGWKRFKRLAKRAKKMLRMVKQSKLRSYKSCKKYMYGIEIPRNYDHGVRLDKLHDNDRWQSATKLEMGQLHEYDTFHDKGIGTTPGEGFKKIQVHLVYAVKHDGRHKARLCANGNLTEVPIDSVYSGVVSLKSLRTVIFLAELNGLETWATDIGNAYLEAETSEKVFVIAGPEFGELEGHTLVIFKALYGLRSSGLRWSEKFSLCLRDMGFFPSLADPCIWMRRVGDLYEYIAVYVDDLAIASKDPAGIIRALTEIHEFKLKGTGPIEFHLGCDFFRDEEGVLCFAPRKYIEKLVASYERMFGSKPKTNKVTSPLVKGDHPEIDDSAFLEEKGIQQYQSLIGQLQWAISLGRFDISVAIMTMSSFRSAPRDGHLDRVKRICGYLSKMRHSVIRIRTEEPDYSAIPKTEYDWESSVYSGAKEELPKNAPQPLGNPVVTTTYVDANLYHCMLTGKSVTGVLHLFNKTPVDWYAKKQSSPVTATYGSEFVAARTATEQIIDNRLSLRYLGVPIKESFMFGDNESVVNSSNMPAGKLHKRHIALSWHIVRETIAANVLRFIHMPGAINPADMLSKHWGYQQTWPQLQALLFWQGDTSDLFKDDDTLLGESGSVKFSIRE
jgi:hypothetical protein